MNIFILDTAYYASTINLSNLLLIGWVNGERATDRRSSHRPFNRKTDRKIPRHLIDKLCNGPIRSLASVKRFQ